MSFQWLVDTCESQSFVVVLPRAKITRKIFKNSYLNEMGTGSGHWRAARPYHFLHNTSV